MNDKKILKIIGFAATIIGLGASLATSWVGEKQMNSKISEEVSKALAEKN